MLRFAENGFEKGSQAMKNPRRRLNIALIASAVVVVGSLTIAGAVGGRSASSGNAQACGAFWNWHYQASAASTAPMLSAYKEATTQPLIADLYNVSVGLKGQAKGLFGNKAANAAFAQSAANLVKGDCTSVGYPNPDS